MRFYFFTVSVCIMISLVFINPHFSYSLTVKEENELGTEVLNQIKNAYPIVDDYYVDKYLNDLGQTIVKNSDNRLFDFKFFVIKNSVYNAFAVPGGYIFVHTGLIAAMEQESELAGILAHEAAHVTSRHIARQVEDSKKVSLAALAGIAAGIAIGMSGGDPDAVMGVIAGTQAAGQSAMLSYSREHEREADKKGLIFLTKAGYSPEGLLDILRKIRAKEFYTEDQAPVYLRTHPGTTERIEYISSYIDDNRALVEKCTLGDGYIFSRFNKAKIKITALYEDKTFALKKFEEMEKDPEKRPGAYYGLALLSMKEADYDKSEKYFSLALKFNALDSELLFDYGNALFLKGDFEGALKKFNTIKAHGVGFLELDLLCGRSFIGTGQFTEAKELFDLLVLKYPDTDYLWYYKGIANEKAGYEGLAHLSLGKFNELKHQKDLTLFHYKKAVSLLKDDQKKEAQKMLDDFLDKTSKKKKKPDKEKDEDDEKKEIE